MPKLAGDEPGYTLGILVREGNSIFFIPSDTFDGEQEERCFERLVEYSGKFVLLEDWNKKGRNTQGVWASRRFELSKEEVLNLLLEGRDLGFLFSGKYVPPLAFRDWKGVKERIKGEWVVVYARIPKNCFYLSTNWTPWSAKIPYCVLVEDKDYRPAGCINYRCEVLEEWQKKFGEKDPEEVQEIKRELVGEIKRGRPPWRVREEVRSIVREMIKSWKIGLRYGGDYI